MHGATSFSLIDAIDLRRGQASSRAAGSSG
jgi:hypothetical protein